MNKKYVAFLILIDVATRPRPADVNDDVDVDLEVDAERVGKGGSGELSGAPSGARSGELVLYFFTLELTAGLISYLSLLRLRLVPHPQA